MKRIFVIDWMLIPAFALSACSGIGLHVAGHGVSHEVWHNWAVFHVLASLLFLVVAAFHVSTHWGWYKGILKRGIGKKSKVTVVLSALFLLEVVTGIIVLLCADGANSRIGLWHYEIGIVMSLIAIGHTLKRIPALRKSLA